MNYYLKRISGYVLVSIVITPTLCFLIYKKEVPHIDHIPERSFSVDIRQNYISGISDTTTLSAAPPRLLNLDT